MTRADEFEQAIIAWSEASREDKAEMYDQFLWPEVRRRFTRHMPPAKTYDVLIIPVSNLHTALLHIDHYRPMAAVFLFTEQSFAENAERLRIESDECDVAYDDNGGLINASDTLSVYQAVRRAYARYPDQRIAIDITGGTKAMSVGAAMAGAVLGLDSIYIESKFDKGIQDRRPGNEQPHRLPDPYQTFGDLKRPRAFDFYRRHDYATAEELFTELSRRVQPPDLDAAWANLAKAYAAWDAFNLTRAADTLERLRDNPARRSVLSDHEPRLREQVIALRRVQDLVGSQRPDRDDPKTWKGTKSFWKATQQYQERQIQLLTRAHVVPSLLAMLYSAAQRRKDQDQLDSATLLLYRCLELMSQQRLARYGGLTEYYKDLINMLGEKLGECDPSLEDRYEVARQKAKLDGLDFPKGKITLLTGYLLLQAVDDPFAIRCDLAAIQDRTESRNENILAHGFSFINPKEYQAFKTVVDTVIDYWCAAERITWATYLDTCTFVVMSDLPPQAN